MTAGLPLMKAALTPLARNVLCHCLNYRQEGMSAADAPIQKKIYGSSTTASIISNEEMQVIINSRIRITNARN